MSKPAELIDVEEAFALLERAVSEKGAEYVDPNAAEDGCIYFDPETKAACCIVGHVISYKGVTLDDLNEGFFLNSETNVHGLNEEIPIFTGIAEELLTVAQDAQDKGENWGKALDEARKSLARWKANGEAEEANA